jgi:hypothetical protein
MRSPYALIVALAAAALLAGCGGGDDSTESAPVATVPTTTAVTQAELIERGDAICAEVNAAVGTVGSSTEAGGSAAGAAGLYAGMVDSLKGIGPPREAEGYPEFIAAAEALSTAEDEVELASEREDTAALESAESNASTALTSFQEAAEEYGFEECSEGPSAPVSGGAEPEAGETGSEAPEEPEAEAVEPEAEAEPEPAPETGGAGGTAEGGGTTGSPEGGGTGGGSSGGIGP